MTKKLFSKKNCVDTTFWLAYINSCECAFYRKSVYLKFYVTKKVYQIIFIEDPSHRTKLETGFLNESSIGVDRFPSRSYLNYTGLPITVAITIRKREIDIFTSSISQVTDLNSVIKPITEKNIRVITIPVK